MIGKTAVLFDAGVSGQNSQIASDCLLFAELAANGRVSQERYETAEGNALCSQY